MSYPKPRLLSRILWFPISTYIPEDAYFGALTDPRVSVRGGSQEAMDENELTEWDEVLDDSEIEAAALGARPRTCNPDGRRVP